MTGEPGLGRANRSGPCRASRSPGLRVLLPAARSRPSARQLIGGGGAVGGAREPESGALGAAPQSPAGWGGGRAGWPRCCAWPCFGLACCPRSERFLRPVSIAAPPPYAPLGPSAAAALPPGACGGGGGRRGVCAGPDARTGRGGGDSGGGDPVLSLGLWGACGQHRPR